MMEFVSDVLTVLVTLFVLALGVGALVLVVMYVIDVRQTEHAIRRNYPVIGRFRYLFEEIGEFFRQYFFAMDREEMPFNVRTSDGALDSTRANCARSQLTSRCGCSS